LTSWGPPTLSPASTTSPGQTPRTFTPLFEIQSNLSQPFPCGETAIGVKANTIECRWAWSRVCVCVCVCVWSTRLIRLFINWVSVIALVPSSVIILSQCHINFVLSSILMQFRYDNF
jgi:hypothetical protein